jgi:arylsulfatase A
MSVSRMFVPILVASMALGSCRMPLRTQPQRSQRPPNIILVFADDLGYADVAPFNSENPVARPRTPNLDRLAAEGIRLTNFYVAQAVCSASRAAVLTGAYSNRVSITGALDPAAQIGLNPEEMTIAEILKRRNYATAIYGKWHLGHHRPFLPTRQGFDEYFGLPYSNDMWPHHPVRGNLFPELPLLEGEEVIELDPDQSQLTRQYTERAVQFVEKNRSRPFFIYLAHTMPHVPLFASAGFVGKTGKGLYQDVIAEIDWSIGRLMETLRRLDLDTQTLLIFTSDNGPWLSYGNHAGSAAPFREGKQTAFEGGVRVPFIARWPGTIPGGATRHQPAMTIDLLPTFAALAGAGSPQLPIDGRDIWPLLANTRGAASPHDALYFYWGNELHAVRSGRWKLHLPHPYQSLERAGSDGRPGTVVRKQLELSLFDLECDPGEKINLAGKYPDEVERLIIFVERAREDLGDTLTNRTGRNVRAAGRLSEPDQKEVVLHRASSGRRPMTSLARGVARPQE